MRSNDGHFSELALFWASFAALFFEVFLIRWLSAEIRVFAYFHNLVLLFCFLGIGLGVARPSARASALFTITILGCLVVVIVLSDRLGALSLKHASVYLSRINDMPIWYRSEQPRLLRHVAELALGTVMVLMTMSLLTALFVPLGQQIGHQIDTHGRPLRAYAINLIGSLAGIQAFQQLSAWALPPTIWILVGGVSLAPLLWPRWREFVVAGLLLAVMAGLLREERTSERWSLWSPYQRLTVEPIDVPLDGHKVRYGHAVLANGVGYMAMSNYSEEFQRSYPALYPRDQVPFDHYNIAYRFANRVDSVLVVGAGTGNDVAGALRNGARRVTAVEIDPLIIDIGRSLHPEHPYTDARVRVVNDDARSFFKKTNDRYDLVVFGLLDSMTLSSSYSNVRLDNYVYTLESIREARRLLSEHGVLVLLFEVEDDFIGARLERILREAFGRPPTGFLVRSGLRGWGGYGFVTGDPDVIESRLASDPTLASIVAKHQPVLQRWSQMGAELTTDDWPFLYLRTRGVPTVHLVLFGILALCSYGGIRGVVGSGFRLNWHFFLLGAAFMLLEVQNITKMALLFGNTWLVSALVISGVLCMGLLANWAVIRWRMRSYGLWYACLFGALLIVFAVPLETFSGLSAASKAIAAGAFYSLPIFFAGIVFSASFEREPNHAAAFASNLFGAMVGGMLESLAFVMGVQLLIFLALALYAGSALRAPRSRPAAAA